MATPWKDVTQQENYLALSDMDKTTARNEYFDTVVLPNLPVEAVDKTRTEFSNYANSLDVEQKQPSFLGGMFKGAAKRLKRGAGIGIGIVNSPLAFTWGAQEAKFLHPEEYSKLSSLDQTLADIGGGFESAKKSMFKEGEFGTLYGEYFKSVTGSSIRDSMEQGVKNNVKWEGLSINKKAAIQAGLDIAAPTAEILANIISDPVITFGEAARIAQLKIPKHWTGRASPEVVAEIEKLAKLDAVEKSAVQNSLLDAMKNRRDYMQWWEDNLHKFDLRERGGPLLKPDTTPVKSKLPPGFKAGTSKTGVTPAKVIEMRELKKKIQTAKATKEDHARLAELVRDSEKVSLNREIASGKIGQPLERPKPIAAGTYSRATGGAILGIEEDEEGNFRYNIGKGLAGSLLVAGGINLSGKNKQFMKTISKSPAWAKVHGMVGKEKRSFSFAGLWGKFNSKTFDRLSKLKALSPEAYNEARIFGAHKDQAGLKFDELVEGFAKVKEDEVILTDYIDAHRAHTRSARGLKNPNGVTLADSKQAIREMEDAYSASGKDVQNLRDAFNNFQEWSHKYILQEALESGLISKAAFTDIVKNNKWYATFDVLDHLPPDINNIPVKLSGEYFSVGNQNVIKKMIGTEKKIANPIEATVRKFVQAQEVFARNKVASTLIDDPLAKEFIRPVAANPKQFKIMQNQGLNPVMEGAWNKKEFGTINRFKDGRVEKYITDIDIAETMKQLSTKQISKVMGAINAVFRASATTLYLPFTISNAVRDFLMAYTTAPVYKVGSEAAFVRDWSVGFWNGLKHEFLGSSDIAKEYIKSGGGFGYVGTLRKTNLARKGLFKKGLIKTGADIVTSPIKLIEKLSATVELAPRLGTFSRAKMMGRESKDAALVARQSTIDFNRGGTLTKVVNQWVPFLNARVQGRVTLGQALIERPAQTASKIAVSVGTAGLGTYAWNRLYHSDLYDDIPEYIKQNYFVVITGEGKDNRGKTAPQYIVIPKGDVGQMAWNPIEFGLDKLWEKDTEKASKFLVNYLSDLSPVAFAREGELSATKAGGSLLPPIAKGFLEEWANLKFYTGTEIVPYWMGKTKPPELQYKENTPESYKWLGKKLKVSPLRLQNFASNVFAGYGREGLDPSAMMRGLTGRIIKTQGGEHERQAWTVIKDIEQGYVYTKAYAEELVKNGDRQSAVKLIHDWNKGLNNQIKEYNNQFVQYGLGEKGGIRRSYTFTSQKIRGIYRSEQRGRGTPLEKRLTGRRR